MKTKNSSLERKRPLLFIAGLLFAVSLALVSFEWRTPYVAPILPDPKPLIDDEVVWVLPVKIEDPEEKRQRPEPPKQEPQKSTEFDIVDQDDIVDVDSDDLIISDDDLLETNGPIDMPIEDDVNDNNIPKIWERPGVMPEYCGGEQAMFEFLSKELVYPEIPRINGVTGKVYVRFVVGKSGKVRDAKVIRSADPWLDAEALRVAKLLDCFTPGRQAGQKVDVYFILPVKFSLDR